MDEIRDGIRRGKTGVCHYFNYGFTKYLQREGQPCAT